MQEQKLTKIEYHPAVLLAVRNGEPYLKEMLESLEKQTFRDFTCYIHDDGSTDHSPEIIQEWADKDPRFHLLQGPPTGSAKNNFLWMLSQVDADSYMFADHDDVWLPEKIEKSVRLLESYPRITAVFTDMYVTDENLKILSNSFIRDLKRDISRTAYTQLIIDNLAAGCTQLFTRRVRDAALKLRHPDQVEVHDEWTITLAAAMGQVKGIDEPLVYYRQHGSNEIGASHETIAHRVSRNFTDLAGGHYLAEKKAFIERSRKLAGELAQIEDIPENRRRILSQYSQIARLKKPDRIRFYQKYGFNRLTGTKWMYLWI